MMNQSENRVEPSDNDPAPPRDRALIYGFVVSLIGLPIGIILKLPAVWVLSMLFTTTFGILPHEFSPIDELTVRLASFIPPLT